MSVKYFLQILFLNEIYLYVYLYEDMFICKKDTAAQKVKYVHQSLQSRELNTKFMPIKIISYVRTAAFILIFDYATTISIFNLW